MRSCQQEPVPRGVELSFGRRLDAEHFAAVVVRGRCLGLSALIASERTRGRDRVEATVAARIIDPSYKPWPWGRERTISNHLSPASMASPLRERRTSLTLPSSPNVRRDG